MIVIKPSAIPVSDNFARASSATYIGTDGWLKTAGNNAPRYVDGRILMEGAASNLLQYSEDLRNTAEAGGTRPWTQTGDSDTQVALVSTTLPTGATGNCSKLGGATAGTAVTRQTGQSITGLADGVTLCMSAYVKAAECARVMFLIGTKAGQFPNALFNVATGVLVSSWDMVATGVEALSGGWYRLWASAYVGTGGSTPSCTVQLRNTSGAFVPSAVGDGLFVWGAQAEVASAPTSYIARTGAGAASRAADSYTSGYLVVQDINGTAVGLSPGIVDESDAPLWVSGSTYAVNDLVVRTQTHRIYRRLVAGAGTTAPESDTTNWVEVSATQKYRPWDGVVSNDAALLGFYSLGISLFLGGANALSLIGLRGKTATVKVTDGASGAVLYSASKTFADDRYSYPAWPTAGNSWQLVDWHLTGIPAGYPNAVAHVVILAGPSLIEYATVREIYYGGGFDIGETQGGARIGITDYSRKNTDEFGAATFVRRDFSRRLSCEVRVPLADFQRVYNLLADLRATICQWVPEASGTYAPMMMQGWYRDFSIAVAYPTYLLCTLEVESLAVDSLVEEL